VSLKRERVSVKIATLSCILLAGTAWAQTIAVDAGPRREVSSGHVQIAVLLDGKPLKGARVDFCKWILNRDDEPRLFSGLTNDYGVVNPPTLAAGTYRVAASLDDVSNFLLLSVVDDRDAKASVFAMDLTESTKYARRIQNDAIKRAEGLPVRDRVQAFQGAVVDPNGAVLPSVKVRITKNEPGGRTLVLGLTTDSTGHFSAQLPAGVYLGIFYTSGFLAEPVPFEVTKEGSGDLRVALHVDPNNLPIL
jgi:Carboxypeptidase regulatory-like domain